MNYHSIRQTNRMVCQTNHCATRPTNYPNHQKHLSSPWLRPSNSCQFFCKNRSPLQSTIVRHADPKTFCLSSRDVYFPKLIPTVNGVFHSTPRVCRNLWHACRRSIVFFMSLEILLCVTQSCTKLLCMHRQNQ